MVETFTKFLNRRPVLFHGMLCLVLSLVVLFNYWHALDNPLVFDSAGNLTDQTLKHMAQDFSLFSFFNIPRYPVNLTFGLTWQLFGLNPFWFRLGNVILHMLNTTLVYVFCRLLFAEVTDRDQKLWWLPFACAFVYGLNPISLYAVVYVVQRYVVAATFFSLAALICYLKGIQSGGRGQGAGGRGSQVWLYFAVMTYFMAVHCKEHAVMLPLIMVLLTWLLQKYDRALILRLAVPFLLMALIGLHITWVQKWIIAQVYEPHAETALVNFENQVASVREGFDLNEGLMYPLSLMNQSWLYFRYLYLWLIPDWTRMAVDTPVPFVTGIAFPVVFGPLLLLLYGVAGLFFLSKKGMKGVLGFGMLFPMVLFATELSTVRFHENFILYRSYLWMCGFFVVLLPLVKVVPKKVLWMILPVYCLLLVGALQHRLAPFSDKVALWEDVVRKIDVKDKTIPAAYRSWGNLGAAYGNVGDLKKALESYNTSIELYPQYQKAWYGLGIVYYNHKKYEEAIPYFERGTKDDPPYNASFYRLGMIYYMLDRYEEAEKYLKLSLIHNPDHLETKENLGNVYFKQGKIDEAWKYYKMSIDEEPGFVKGWNGMGKVMMHKGQHEKAIEYFSNAVNVLPTYTESYYNLGVTYSELGQPQKALTYYRQALQNEPDHKETLYNLGNTLLKLGQAEEAVQVFQKSLQVQPGNIDSRHNLAIALAHLGRYEEAVVEYEKVLRERPEHSKALYNLGNALASLGRQQEALQSYFKSLRIDPDYIYALHNAGMMLVQLGSPNDALPFFKKALQQDPGFEPSRQQLEKIQPPEVEGTGISSTNP